LNYFLSDKDICTEADQVLKVVSCRILPQDGEGSFFDKRPIIPGTFEVEKMAIGH
jgi:hypothetical protein